MSRWTWSVGKEEGVAKTCTSLLKAAYLDHGLPESIYTLEALQCIKWPEGHVRSDGRQKQFWFGK